MSLFLGQHQLTPGSAYGRGQQTVREVTASQRQTPPDRYAPPNRNSHGSFTATHNAALLPDNDPWRRQRRRLTQPEPDAD